MMTVMVVGVMAVVGVMVTVWRGWWVAVLVMRVDVKVEV
jgi:hypothetical protein